MCPWCAQYLAEMYAAIDRGDTEAANYWQRQVDWCKANHETPAVVIWDNGTTWDIKDPKTEKDYGRRNAKGGQ